MWVYLYYLYYTSKFLKFAVFFLEKSVLCVKLVGMMLELIRLPLR